jgi:hypothetical protein
VSAPDIIRDLIQAMIELVDDEALEQFRFIDGEHVAATIGTKSGAVCGPVLYYRITGDDAVEIHDDGGRVWFRWERLRLDGGTLHLSCGGRPKEFSITRQ